MINYRFNFLFVISFFNKIIILTNYFVSDCIREVSVNHHFKLFFNSILNFFDLFHV